MDSMSLKNMLKRLFVFILIWTAFIGPAFATLSSSIQFYVRQDGDNTNGGGFKSGATGVNYSDSATPHATLTTLSVVNATTTKITVSTSDYTVTNNDVGNTFNLTGGTATHQEYEITAADTVLNTWTLDKTVGTTGQTVTGKMGGAHHDAAYTATLATVAGMYINLKYSATPYTLTTSTLGIAGGPILLASIAMNFRGYEVTPGDNTGNKPTITWGSVAAPGSLTYMLTVPASNSVAVSNIKLNCNHVNNVGGVSTTGSGIALAQVDVMSADASGTGINGIAAGTMARSCTLTSCTTGIVASGGFLKKCWAKQCGVAYQVGANTVVDDCMATSSTGDGGNGSSTGTIWDGCTMDGNAGDGIDTGGSRCTIINCVATNNARAFNASSANQMKLLGCADYNNTTRLNSAVLVDRVPIALTADPYVSRLGLDFRPNATAGGGLSIRANDFGFVGQTNNRDVGAVQHSDPTGGSGNFAHAE
jgi:hypothetical protein